MSDYDNISNEYVTNQVANGDCTPSLVEQMQSFIDDMANAIVDDNCDTMDALAEQWLDD